MDNLTEIVAVVSGVLGTAGIWKFAEARMKIKSEEKKDEVLNSDGVQYRDDLKKRVTKLEELLEQSSKEKDELRNQVLSLTEAVASLKMKVEFLEKENERLKMK